MILVLKLKFFYFEPFFCHPFEVRYLGTFIEELGRKDYQALKTHEEDANNEVFF